MAAGVAVVTTRGSQRRRAPVDREAGLADEVVQLVEGVGAPRRGEPVVAGHAAAAERDDAARPSPAGAGFRAEGR